MAPMHTRSLYRVDEDHPLLSQLAIADGPLSRMRGLLGRSGLAQDEGLHLTPATSIHMLFMRFAIDAVWLDRQMRVVRVHADLRPWRFARGGAGSRSVLELPAGSAARLQIEPGDRLEIR